MNDTFKSSNAALQDELVTISLENCPSTFKVSKALLCGASDYFTAALEGRFKEAADLCLRLPGCSEDVFRYFVYYLTHGQTLPDFLTLCLQEGGYSNFLACGFGSTVEPHVIVLVELWKFADLTLMPHLQNCAMRWLCRLMGHTNVRADAVRAVFEDTAEDSPVRKALVGEIISEWQWGFLLPHDTDLGTTDMEKERRAHKLDDLGAIPGFLQLCFQELPQWMQSRDLEGSWAPSSEDNWERYKVEEDA